MATSGSNLLQRAIEAILGRPDSVVGAETNYWCYFCKRSGKGSNHHLHVNYFKGQSICHECGAKYSKLTTLLHALGGDVPESLREIHDPEDIEDAVEANLYGEDEGTKTYEKVLLPHGYVRLDRDPRSNIGKAVLSYLTKKRHIPYRTLREIRAGSCDTGRMKGYAILPVTVNGEMVNWTSRNVVALGQPKVRHATGGRAKLTLFNYDRCHQAKRLFLCEGPFDALHMHGRLLPADGGLGLLGTILHDEQAHMIADLPAEEAFVLLDGDRAGREKTAAVAEKLETVANKRVYVVDMPEGKDPDEVSDKILGRTVDAAHGYDEMDMVESLMADDA